jgi:uncharacterized protein with FMN-binding domain
VKMFLKMIALLAAIVVISSVFGYAYLTRGLKEVALLTVNTVGPVSLADGTYTGSYDGYRWATDVTITVKSGAITGIQVTKDQAFQVPQVKETILSRVMQAQSTKVDIVTGSTVSSKAYLKAIENALSSAKR